MTAATVGSSVWARVRLRWGHRDERPSRLYLRFAIFAGIALALAGGVSLWRARADATSRAQLAVWRDAAFMADRLGRDDLAKTALAHAAVGDEQLLLDDLFDSAAVSPGIVRVTLFQPDGTITYSSNHALIGTITDRPDLLQRSLARGRAYDIGAAGGKRVLESYVPVHWLLSPNGRPSGVLAVYRDYGPVAKEIAGDLRVEAATTAIALLLLYVAMFPILHGVTRALAVRNRRLLVQTKELRRLAVIVESSNDAIVGADADGTITSWNGGAERLYGWTAAEMLGQSASVLLPLDRDDVVDEALAAIRGGRGIANHHTAHRRKDGGRIDVFLTLSPIRDASGALTGASMIARDVTERLELERRLRRTQRAEAVGRLAGGVAHDFNNLLTGIGSYADLAARDLPKGAPARWHLEEIRKAIARGAALTRQLLDFESRREVRPQVVDLNAIVRDALPLLRRVIGEDVQLDVEAHADVLRVKTDPGRLEELVVDLVLNARDAIPGGGSIAVRTAAADGGAVLTVSDSGVGDARHGLELAALWELVQTSGGTMAVESEPTGGTTVRVRLPLAEGPVAEPRPAEPVPDAPAPASATVLLVEDEEIVRAVVREVLETSGYTVVAAHNGRQALELCASHEGAIDVMLSDVVMPELGGLELAEHVRRLHPDIAVVLMSGYPDNSLRLDGTPMRMLAKPFSHDELLREIGAALAERPAAGV